MNESVAARAERPPKHSAKTAMVSGLNSLFVPETVAVIGATERPGWETTKLSPLSVQVAKSECGG